MGNKKKRVITKNKVIKRSKSNNKKVKNTRITETSDGVKFKSSLEAFTYQKLLEANITNFKYEQDKFVLVDAFNFPLDSYEMCGHKLFESASNNIRPMTYKPDFVSIDNNKKGWIIEVKGFANDASRGALI